MNYKGFPDFPEKTPQTGVDFLVGYGNGVEYRYPYADLAGSGISQEEADQLYYPRTGDPSGYAGGGGSSLLETGSGGEYTLQNAFGLGDNRPNAEGLYSIALSRYAHASGDFSIAIGQGAEALSDRSIALGNGAIAKGEGVVSYGRSSNVKTHSAVWQLKRSDNATNQEVFLVNGSEGLESSMHPGSKVTADLDVCYRELDFTSTSLETVKMEKIYYTAFKDGGGSYTIHSQVYSSGVLLDAGATFSISFDTPNGLSSSVDKIIIPKITTTNIDGGPPSNLDVIINGKITISS